MKRFFKKIRNSWRNNRVLFVLTFILIICLILIAVVSIDYFFGSSDDKYGDRLQGISKVEMTDKKIKKIEKGILKDEKIANCEINQIGKMIYVTINFNEGITLVEAQGKALTTLELFSKKELEFYDINYTLLQSKTENSEGFTTMGTKNVNGSGLVWVNNTPISEDVE